jgi:hypothetical protein
MPPSHFLNLSPNFLDGCLLGCNSSFDLLDLLFDVVDRQVHVVEDSEKGVELIERGQQDPGGFG